MRMDGYGALEVSSLGDLLVPARSCRIMAIDALGLSLWASVDGHIGSHNVGVKKT